MTEPESGSVPERRHSTSSRWVWFVVLGIALAVLGIFAMSAPVVSTLAAVFAFGWALIIGGILQAVHAIYQRDWGGRVLDVLTGVLFVVVGALALFGPVTSAMSLTLLIAAALLIRGIFAIVAAVSERYAQWGWSVVYGVVSVLLGGLIFAMWPAISMWLIGLFVGIELLVDGIVLAMIGLSARKVSPRGLGRRPPREVRAPREPLPA